VGRNELLPRRFPNCFFGGTEKEVQLERRGVLSPVAQRRKVRARRRAAVGMDGKKRED